MYAQAALKLNPLLRNGAYDTFAGVEIIVRYIVSFLERQPTAHVEAVVSVHVQIKK